MQELGKSTLLKKTGQLVAFGFEEHPVKPNWFLEMNVFKTDDKWIICFSEGEGEGNREKSRTELGNMFPGTDFARHAHSCFDAFVPYQKVQEILNNLPKMNIEWLPEDQITQNQNR